MKYIAYGVEPGKADHTLIQRITDMAPEYKVIPGRVAADFTPHMEQIEIAFRVLEPEIVSLFPTLKWYQAWSAGVDWMFDSPDFMNSNYLLTTASGIHPVPMTEHIFSLLLSLSRGLNSVAEFRSERSWKRVPSRKLIELEGRTLLLFGAGAIGRRTATIARAFGMRVIAVKRRNLDHLGPFDELVPLNNFHEYLDKCDVVLNILPLTTDTENLFGAREFRRMRNDAIFINIGRGKTVDQSALVQALVTGEIASAGLDVVDPEPLPPDSPLWEMKNVILTGHYGGITPHYEERGNEIFLNNLKRYLGHKPLENLVDRKRGY